jgi:hypothetical protein
MDMKKTNSSRIFVCVSRKCCRCSPGRLHDPSRYDGPWWRHFCPCWRHFCPCRDRYRRSSSCRCDPYTYSSPGCNRNNSPDNSFHRI